MTSRSDEARIKEGWEFVIETKIDECCPASPPVQTSVGSASSGSLEQGCGCVERSVPHMKRKVSKRNSIQRFCRRSNSNKLRSSNKRASRGEKGARTRSSCDRDPHQKPGPNPDDLEPSMAFRQSNYVLSSSMSEGLRSRDSVPRTMADFDMSSLKSLGLRPLEGSTGKQAQEHAVPRKYRDPAAYGEKAGGRIAKELAPAQRTVSDPLKSGRNKKQNAVYAEPRQNKRAESAGQKENQTPDEEDQDSNPDESTDDEINHASCRPN